MGEETKAAQSEPLKVGIAIPAYRRMVDVDHIPAALNLGAALKLANQQFQFSGFMCIDTCSLAWGRNMLLHNAVERDVEWLLTMDADTYCMDAWPVLSMILTGQELGAAAIAAPVERRTRDTYNVMARIDGRWGYVPKESFWDKVALVECIGTAMMAINVSWIREHWRKQPWFHIQDLEGDKPERIGEDMSFCIGARERGGKIVCDGRVHPTHIGEAVSTFDGVKKCTREAA